MAPVTAPLDVTRPVFKSWFTLAGLMVAVLLTYWNSLDTPFLFDDTGAVVNNPTIRHLGSWAVLDPPADGSTTSGRPLVNLSFAINYAISGEATWSYHALNLLIHALAALTLMSGLQRTLTSPVLGARFARASHFLAFFIALLWALHPLQTESVVCIAQRTESLCGLFYLLTIYGFIRAAEAGASSTRVWFVLSLVSCFAGMGTKEVMVTAPLLVLLYDRTFIAGTFSAAWRGRRTFYAALALTWAPLAWLVWRSGGERGTAAGFRLGVSGWNYLLQQCDAIVLYLKLSVWPHPLVLDYGTVVAHSIADVWWQGVLVVAMLAATGWALWRRPAAGFAGAWFFIILAPSSSFVPLVTQTMAEHRMYLPLVAIVCFIVLAVHRWLGPWATGVLALAALACGITSVARNRDYRDAVAIWSDSTTKYPLNPRAHNNLAWALQAVGNIAEANTHFSRAVELQPDYISAHYNWGVSLLDQGRPAEAIAQFETALQLAPNNADASLNLGNALMQVQRAPEAINYYETALRLKPAADAHYNLGVALLDLERTAEATEHLQAAIKINPRLTAAHYQLGRAAEISGRPTQAEQHYLETLRLAPDHIAAHGKLGLLLARREQLASAAEHFRAVIRLQPRDADAQANLGNVLLLEDKPRDAITCYEEALRLRPGDQRTRDNLQLARESLR